MQFNLVYLYNVLFNNQFNYHFTINHSEIVFNYGNLVTARPQHLRIQMRNN
jgi:hypothetical protein